MKDLGARARELAVAFDLAFTAPRPADPGERVALLAVRVAGQPFALAQAGVRALDRGRPLVVPPGAHSPTFVGLAGVRGQLFAVHDLAALLELDAGAPTEAGERWLALAADEPGLALAFERLDGQHLVAATALREAEAGPARAFAPRVWIDPSGGLRPVLEMSALAAEVRRRVGAQR